MDVYKQFGVSLAELQLKVHPCGKVGKYLFEQLEEFNHKAAVYNMAWPHGEVWGLGDQATVAVLMEELEKVSYEMIPAPRVADDMTYIHGQDYRKIRLYKTAEVRLTLEDFLQNWRSILDSKGEGKMKKYLVIDAGGTAVKYALMNESAKILKEANFRRRICGSYAGRLFAETGCCCRKVSETNRRNCCQYAGNVGQPERLLCDRRNVGIF